jgi:hypothetical protein
MYWTPGGILPPGNSAGIGIAEDTAGRITNFQARVAADLDTLNAIVPTGQALVNAIMNGIAAGKRLGIVVQRMFTGGWGANECASLGGGAARTQEAEAVGSGSNNTVINALKLKMNTTGHHKDWNWLCQQIRQVPRYQLQGTVALAPANPGLLPLDVQRWIEGTRPLYNGLAPGDVDQVKNAIMVVLAAPGGTTPTPGAGSASRVYYDPRKNFNSLGPRPAHFGLAHELVHHYYNMQGAQLSHSEDSAHFSTVLYEYMCVGLGPWAGATISENAIRNDAAFTLRTRYA